MSSRLTPQPTNRGSDRSALDVVYVNSTPFWAWVLVASVVMLAPRKKSIPHPASVA
ncbi:hypothetical protein ACXC9Q_27885 [Kribbella sp. CWNU-51]